MKLNQTPVEIRLALEANISIAYSLGAIAMMMREQIPE